MNFPFEYALASLILLGPLAAIAMWTDIKTMLIKNWTNGLFAIIAAILAAAFLGWPDVGYHVAFGGGIMLFLFLPAYYGHLGGGDWKMFGAVGVSLGFVDFARFGVLLAATTIVVLLLHRAIGFFVRPRDPGQNWASFHRPNHFPFGVTIGLAYLIYMSGLAIRLA